LGKQKGLMSGHDGKCSACIAFGQSVVYSDADRSQVDHDFAIPFPAVDVRRLMIPRVDPHVKAVLAKNGWHCGSISEPLGFC